MKGGQRVLVLQSLTGSQMASQHCMCSLLLRGKRFFPVSKWIFNPRTKSLLLFILNRETKVKGNFICVSFVSPRRAELGDQNLSKCPVLGPVAWESGRNRQQGSVPVRGPAVKVLDTLCYSCSSAALAVQVSHVHAETGYTSMSLMQGRGS